MKSFLSIFLFLTLSVQAQNGIIRSYYGNHKLRARLSFVNDVLDAKNIWYYDNGNIKTIKTYDLGKLNGKVSEFYKSGLIKEIFSVANGIRDGIDRIYWENGALKEIRSYEMGKLVKRVTIENDPLFVPKISDYKGIISNKKISHDEDAPLCDVEICPTPLGGITAIQERVIYPKEAKQYGLEGTVSIVATIDKAGHVTVAKVIKGLGLGCNQAALKAVKESFFLPGLNKGKTVNSHLTIDIKFKIKTNPLTESKKQKYINTKQPDIENMLPKINIEDSIDILITQTGQNKKETIQKIAPDISDKYKNNNSENKTNVADSKITKESHFIEKQKIKKITCDVEICPEPVGGMAALIKRFNIPRIAYKLKLNGVIVVKAKIDKWGNVLDTKVISGVGHGVGTAAEVAILFTKFKPGMENGESINASITITLPVKTAHGDSQ